MKARFLFLPALLAAATLSAATSDPVRVENLRIAKERDSVYVSLVLDLCDQRIGRNEVVTLVPVLQGADRSLELPAVEILGRNQAVIRERNKQAVLNGYRWSASSGKRIPYSAQVAYEDWMKSYTVLLADSRRKCCQTAYDSTTILQTGLLPVPAPGPAPAVFLPSFAFLAPGDEHDGQEKARSVSGTAYVRFPVNRWEILQEYRDNYRELAKIHDTLSSIQDDQDAEITALYLKGYASPESSWSHNAMLAERRTIALKNYLQDRYGLHSSIFRTEYEPEDWEGLRKYVQQSRLPHRQEILNIIDSGLDYDTREALIKSRYPADYRLLLDDCYPSLRHSDYRIEYRIRNYTDLEDLRRVFQEHPGKLSVRELQTLASGYEEGSGQHAEVWRTAAALYPNHPAANLNAATHALKDGNYDLAGRYLVRAGDSPEAKNARAILAWYTGDTAAAVRLLREAASHGLPAAIANETSILSIINQPENEKNVKIPASRLSLPADPGRM